MNDNNVNNTTQLEQTQQVPPPVNAAANQQQAAGIPQPVNSGKNTADSKVYSASTVQGQTERDTNNQDKSPNTTNLNSRQETNDASMGVTKRDIENVVSSWTGIPISKLTEDESAKLLQLEDRIHKRLIDQEEAVVKVSEAVRRGRIGLASGQRPIASFIFLGPSGTGKTELAKTLAEILFGKDDMMVRLDMSEYMEKHEVAKIIGAPPGYVGYEEGGQLTEAVRAKPYSIVLLDEVEKAHPDVFNILLQLLEDGRLTDNKGNIISFKNTIVICTSNIGSGMISEKLSKEDLKTQKTATQYAKDYIELSAVVNNELRKFFRPELLNRFDDIVIFKPLQRSDMVGIAKLGIEKTAKLLKEQGFSVQITDRALSKIAKEGYDPMYGARPLRRLIQNSLENPIALEIIGRKYVAGDTILIDYKGDTNAYSFLKGNKVSNSPGENNQPGNTAKVDNPNTGQIQEDVKNSDMNKSLNQARQSQNTQSIPGSGQVNQSQIYYGAQLPENTPGGLQASNVPPVTNFDPLSVLGDDNGTGSQITQSSIQSGQTGSVADSAGGLMNAGSETPPLYPAAPGGAYIGGQNTVVNSGRFQQGAANEQQEKTILEDGQLSGSGLNTLNEEV